MLQNPESATAAITVAVRVRPFVGPAPSPDSAAGDGGVKKIIHVVDEQVLVFDPADPNKRNRRRTYVHGARRHKEIQYAFDRVFNEDATQQQVYEGTAKPLIDGVLNGYNATVFAYGATGCGKTHTITGTTQDPGIIFLTMRELFERIETASADQTIETHVSYLEVYNEAIRDLLNITSNESLDLREDDVNTRVVVAGLSEHKPRDVNHVMRMLIEGNNNRTRAPTEANAVSSRSHAVLQIHVRQKDRAVGVTSNVKMATLSIIDLAGSERASVTKNQGKRLLEGANINRSLLALGNCINALCSDRPNHIPYRDSKLTRLLKYSLGGNCRVVMITAISASSIHFDETHNTLKYANRAKNIKTKVEQNTIDVAAHMAHYPQLIADLKSEVELLRGQLATKQVPTPVERPATVGLGMREDSFDMLIRKVRRIFEKADLREIEKCEALAEVEKNERKLGVLKRAVAALVPQDTHDGEAPEFITTRVDELVAIIEDTHTENVRLRHNANQARLALLRLNTEAEKIQTGPVSEKLSDEQRNRLRVEMQLMKLGSQNALLMKQVEICQRNLEVEAQALQDTVDKSGKDIQQLVKLVHLARTEDLVGEEVVAMVERNLALSARSLGESVEDNVVHAAVEVNWDTGSEASEASDVSDLSDSDASESDVSESRGTRSRGSFLQQEMETMARSYTPAPAEAEGEEEQDEISPQTPHRTSDESSAPATAVKVHQRRGVHMDTFEDGAKTPPRQKRQASPEVECTAKKVRPYGKSARKTRRMSNTESDEDGETGTPTKQRRNLVALDADATPLAKPRPRSRITAQMKPPAAPASPEASAMSPVGGSKSSRTSPVRRSSRRVARQSLIPIRNPGGNRRESMLPTPMSLGIGLGFARGVKPSTMIPTAPSASSRSPPATSNGQRAQRVAIRRSPSGTSDNLHHSQDTKENTGLNQDLDSASLSNNSKRAQKDTTAAKRLVRPRFSLAPSAKPPMETGADKVASRARRASAIPSSIQTRSSTKRLAELSSTSSQSPGSGSDDGCTKPKWK